MSLRCLVEHGQLGGVGVFDGCDPALQLVTPDRACAPPLLIDETSNAL
jgi:hypothetical protein